MKIKLLLILLLISGCGYNAIDNTKHVIITDIESGGNGNGTVGCFYYVKGNTAYRITEQAYFFDKCGKYTVGDTIHITKKP